MSLIRFGILTVSDRSARGERADASGPALVQAVQAAGWEVCSSAIVPDEQDQIEETLKTWCDRGKLDVILTTGGTGFAARDVTPEATLAAIEKHAPGIAEAIRQASLRITPHAMLSRGVAGIRKKTLIVNLPGSPKGAVESLAVIQPVLQHAVDLLSNDPGAESGHNPIKDH